MNAEIFIQKDGEQFGPYLPKIAKKFVSKGVFRETDLAWCEGMELWHPLRELLKPKGITLSYFVSRNGTQLGPFNFRQLRDLWAERHLAIEDFIRIEGSEDWKPVAQFVDQLKAPAKDSQAISVAKGILIAVLILFLISLVFGLMIGIAHGQDAAHNQKFQEALARLRARQAAPAASTGPSLSLDAHESGSGRGVDHNLETDYGTYDRNYNRTKNVAIEVKNLSSTPAKDAEVEIDWVSWSHDKGNYVSKRDVQKVDVPGASFSRVEALSPVVQENVQNYAALGEKYAEGEKLVGWIVTLRYQGANVQTQPCSALQSFNTPEKLAKLLAVKAEAE